MGKPKECPRWLNKASSVDISLARWDRPETTEIKHFRDGICGMTRLAYPSGTGIVILHAYGFNRGNPDFALPDR